MRFSGNNIAIKLDHDATGADLQLFKQPSQAQPVRDLLIFSVDPNLHVNEKTVSTAPPNGGQGIRFQARPDRLSRALTGL